MITEVISSALSLAAQLAEAYRRAALDGIDMRRAADVLETARLLAGKGDAVEVAENLAGVVASAVETEALCRLLGTIRQAVVDMRLEAELGTLRSTQAQDPAEGERARWLALARAVAELSFEIAARIVADRPAGSADLDSAAEKLTLVRAGRWREGAPLIERLVGVEGLSAPMRARLLALAAEVRCVVFLDGEAARAHLAEAASLGEDEWRVAYVRGRVTAELDGRSAAATALAEACFQSADRLAQGRAAAPLIRLGDLRRNTGDLAGAEACYVRATQCAAGASDGWASLIELAGQPALFAERRSRIEALVARATLVAANTGEPYDAMLAAAEAMRSNQDIEAFEGWVERAIVADPARIGAFVARGYAYLDLDMLDRAEAAFDQVTTIAPQAPDGWWGKVSIAQERQEWSRFLDNALATLRRAPDWSDAIRDRVEVVAAELKRTDAALARGFYEALRQALGEQYEASLRNNLGNLFYYGGDMRAAAEEYRLAVAASPGTARFRANLAIAIEDGLGAAWDTDLAEAVALTEAALAIEPGNKEYAELHERLLVRQRYTEDFGMAARQLVPDLYRLRVFLGPGLVQRIVIEETRLQPWVVERLAALRAAILAEAGFTLCSVRFGALPAEERPEIACALEIFGERVWEGTEAAMEDDALRPVEAAIRAHLPALFCHEEAREMAGAEPEAAHPYRVNALVAEARARLRQGQMLDPGALRDWMLGLAVPGAVSNAETPSTPSAPVVIRHHPLVRIEADFAVEAQKWVYYVTGVVLPAITCRETKALSAEPVLIERDGATLETLTAFTSKPVAEALAAHAGILLAWNAVAFHLLTLKVAVPALVDVVQALVPPATLLAALRTRCEGGRSIRNFMAVLEEIALMAGGAALQGENQGRDGV